MPISLQLLEFQRTDKIIHVGFSLAQALPATDSLLTPPFISPLEWERSTQFQHHRAQSAYLLGRQCAKQALQRLDPTLDLSSLSITSGLPGNPLLIGSSQPYEISISHSLDFALAVASPSTHPVAIDLERIRPERSEAIHRMLTEQEQERVHASPDPTSHATLLWTAKEALSKWLRSGMSIDFKVLEIKTIQQEEDRISGTFTHLFHLRFESWRIGDWWLTIVFPNKSRFQGFDPNTLSLLQ